MTNITNIEIWYNRSAKSWVVQMLDDEGNQIGDAVYVYTKREAEIAKADMIRRENTLVLSDTMVDCSSPNALHFNPRA